MRYLLAFMLLVGLFVIGKRFSCHFGPGIKGEGPVKTESRSVSGFHAVDLSISANAEITVSDQYRVEIDAQENLLPILKTEVEDGTLRIYFEESVSHTEDLVVRISAPSFDAFSVAGSGTVHVNSPLRSEKMNLNISGSGNILLPDGDFGTLRSVIAGSGDLEIGGRTEAMEAKIAGSGDIDAKKMTARELDATVAGSGSVSCDVSERLKANILGSGDIYYSGSPTVNSNVSGSGDVRKL
ncbi:MAG: DUF2807 domain-containing protein [Lewinellaceae bacterium]|nr:DUF2807 domain-containing protein [Saprospiraceae bacterium]MCB0542486.1 DUF2807 domain-containing protein [Saprospiraceae bacterium]MCB9356528.1 DUF2807 domain-containing protein [Lewinellaceae bacterium]